MPEAVIVTAPRSPADRAWKGSSKDIPVSAGRGAGGFRRIARVAVERDGSSRPASVAGTAGVLVPR